MLSRRLLLQLLIGWITLFVIGVDLFVVSPLLPTITADYHIDPEKGGWMVSLFSVMYVIFSPVFGNLSDKFGRKKLILLGLILFTLANIGTCLSPTYLWLLCSRVVAGISVAAITPSVYAIIGETSPEEKRASALAIVNSGLLTAIWTGAPVGALLGQAFGWQSVFWILAGISGILILVNQLVWPNTFSSRMIATSPIRKTVLIKSVLVTAIWSMSVYGFYTYIGVGFQQEHAYSDVQIATLIMIYGIGALIGSLYGGRLADRVGALKVAKLSLVFMASFLLLIGFFLYKEWFIYILFAGFALNAYAFFPAQQSRLVGMYPNQRGTFLAWNSSFLYLGMTCGAGLGSQVLQRTSFSTLAYMCAIVAFGGFLLLAVMQPKVSNTRA